MDETSNAKQNAILSQVAAIPRGKVSTYGQIAKDAGLPGYARYVGYVLRQLPKGTKIPWHRVLNAQGKISFDAQHAGFKEQRKRLQEEDVVVLAHKVSLKNFAI